MKTITRGALPSFSSWAKEFMPKEFKEMEEKYEEKRCLLHDGEPEDWSEYDQLESEALALKEPIYEAYSIWMRKNRVLIKKREPYPQAGRWKGGIFFRRM